MCYYGLDTDTADQNFMTANEMNIFREGKEKFIYMVKNL